MMKQGLSSFVYIIKVSLLPYLQDCWCFVETLHLQKYQQVGPKVNLMIILGKNTICCPRFLQNTDMVKFG